VIKFLVWGILVGLATVQIAAAAEPETPCPGHPEALGTSRVLAVDPAATPRVGRKHFPTTLPLADKEVVLTFDDGPWPGTTTAVLDASSANAFGRRFSCSAGMRRPIPSSRAESWPKAIRLHTIASTTRCSAA
jgi:hypothetical protein